MTGADLLTTLSQPRTLSRVSLTPREEKSHQLIDFYCGCIVFKPLRRIPATPAEARDRSRFKQPDEFFDPLFADVGVIDMIRLKLEQAVCLIGGDAYTLALMLRRLDHVEGLSAKKGFTLPQVLALGIVSDFIRKGQAPTAIRYAPSIFEALSDTYLFALPSDRLGLLNEEVPRARFLAYGTLEEQVKANELSLHVIDVKACAGNLLRKLLAAGGEIWADLTPEQLKQSMIEKIHPECLEAQLPAASMLGEMLCQALREPSQKSAGKAPTKA